MTSGGAARMTSIGMRREVPGTFEAVVERVPAALEAEGMAVLTRIDVQDLLRQKLGVDFRRYRVFGACDPTIAVQALAEDLGVGVLLPCNLVVLEDLGRTVVIAVDPIRTLGASTPGMASVAAQLRMKLRRALDALAGGAARAG